jgi:hypothetical protein
MPDEPEIVPPITDYEPEIVIPDPEPEPATPPSEDGSPITDGPTYPAPGG